MKNALTSKQQAQEVCSPSATVEICSTFLSKDSSFYNYSLHKLVLEAIDEALSSLGEISRHAIYFHLEKTFKINKQAMPFQIKEFNRALEKILGPGAKLVEIQIMKHLYQKTGHNFKYYPKNGNFTLTEYLTALYTFLNITNKIEKLL